jgi:DNA-binding protein H-NS
MREKGKLMKDSQLEKMSIKELTDLRERVAKMIVSKQESERMTTKDELIALAQERGFTISDLFPTGRKGGKSKGSSGSLYRNPDDPSQTWPGRGRKPKWLAEAGGDIERFRVR